MPRTRVTLRFLTPSFLLPEPAVVVSASPAGEKQQPCPPQAAGVCGPALPSPLRLPARQPTALDWAPTPGPGPRSLAKPASPVYVRSPHLCCCAGLHQLHCSSLLPPGLCKACHSLHRPPQHSGAPGPCQCGAQPPHLCQCGPCSVSAPVCHPVLHRVVPRLSDLHWIPTEPYQDQPVFLLVVREPGGAPWPPSPGPELFAAGSRSLSLTLCGNSLASNLLCRGHWSRRVSLGTCASVDLVAVVSLSESALLLSLCLRDSSLSLGECRCPSSAVPKGERSF